MNNKLPDRLNGLIHERNSLKHLSMENLHALESFVKKNIYKGFDVFSDDIVSILSSKGHYEGIIYNEELSQVPDDQYYRLIEAKIDQLKLFDRVNLVILKIIKHFAEIDDESKEEVYSTFKEEFGAYEMDGFGDLMHFFQHELFSYIYGTDREKPLLPEEVEYFKDTTEEIFNKLKMIFDDQITEIVHVDAASTNGEMNTIFKYSDNLFSPR
jgi:hypothetical protein